MKVLKFKGKYGELKNHGFKFQKLYAANYMQWCKEVCPDSDIRVWKKGNDVELNDHYRLSGIVAEYALNNDPVDITRRASGSFVVLRFVIDKESNEAVDYQMYRHDPSAYDLLEHNELKEEIREKAEPVMVPGLTYPAFFDRFRVVLLAPEYVEAIRELFELDMVELVEVPDF